MFKNYLILAWRNLKRNKSFSFLNILGLAVSMSVCLLIIMILMDQYSYDTYHSKKDRVYRVHTTRYQQNNGETASSALPLAEKLKSDYPNIEEAAALNSEIGGDIIYEEKFATGGGYFADGNLFKILDFSFKEGDPNTALTEPFSMVISSDMAEILFKDESALGKTVAFHDKDIRAMDIEEGNTETDFGYFTITGVLNPSPGKTHLPFKLLASLSTMKSLPEGSVMAAQGDWDNVWSNYTYVLLKEGKAKQDLQSNLDYISEEIYGDKYDNKHSFKAVALGEITPVGFIGNMTHVSVPKVVLVILSILCLIVMFSACLNYTNMSVARALTRVKEVGIRKVSGANKRQIFGQFITEAVVISLCSLFFAFLMLQVLENGVDGLTFNQYLKISLKQSLLGILIFIGFSILVGVVAGVLPATYVAKLNPVNLFNKLNGVRLFKSMGLRNVLLVVQFSISLIFIISVVLIQSQARHILNFDYGFNKENVVTVKLFNHENYPRFAQALNANPAVSSVGGSSLIPAGGWNFGTEVINPDYPLDSLETNYFDVNSGIVEVLDLELVAGKNLPLEGGDNLILINEFAVKSFNLGSSTEAVGKQLAVEDGAAFKNVQIAGVVKDFQFLSPDRPMQSLVLRNRNDALGFALVKVSGVNQAQTLASLEATWKEVNPDSKFSYKYLDQELLFIHQVLGDVFAVIGLISFLAIFVSCLGLLGMATYTAQTRVKEIGIRKTLGSSISQVIFLLSKGFLKLLGIAILLAVPAAYFINNLWLEFFASRVSIGVVPIGIGVGVILLISIGIIFSQAYRAAVINPIESLKNE
ncbi:ABC transporter permease [Algoriphagus halophilus]|uniref:Putative ABC transport system permease protein n=1 Tax=Algoriphagus halophilus TaxID=226505 RepID=A0A1N6EHA3_9BACT|nr:ABC transporter permease [Algoriphagus halophilus]SIN82321.1 putative ABC transport system permease protein [Algoriphagus halophilus]